TSKALSASSHVFISTHALKKSTAAKMNSQLPPNSAIMSAARSASVSCAASSTLTLRVELWRKSSSVCRSRLASAVSISSATSGLLRIKDRKCSRESRASLASSATTASAERRSPSSKAISPKKSPRPSVASVTSCPSLACTQIRTSPLSITYNPSPRSPAWNKTRFAGQSSVSISSHNSLAVGSSSDSNSGTWRRVSTVIAENRNQARCDYQVAKNEVSRPHVPIIATIDGVEKRQLSRTRRKTSTCGCLKDRSHGSQDAKLTWAGSILGWNRARSRRQNREKSSFFFQRKHLRQPAC